MLAYAILYIAAPACGCHTVLSRTDRADRGLPLSTERLIELLHEFPPEEPTRRRFIQEIIGWSGRFGPLERGDPELHHAAGSVYAEGMQTHNDSDFEGDFITVVSRPRTL